MFLQLKFNLFGREIWSLELDKCPVLEESEEDWEEWDDEDEEEDEEGDEDEDPLSFRWGTPHCFERDIFVP